MAPNDAEAWLAQTLGPSSALVYPGRERPRIRDQLTDLLQVSYVTLEPSLLFYAAQVTTACLCNALMRCSYFNLHRSFQHYGYRPSSTRIQTEGDSPQHESLCWLDKLAG